MSLMVSVKLEDMLWQEMKFWRKMNSELKMFCCLKLPEDTAWGKSYPRSITEYLWPT